MHPDIQLLHDAVKRAPDVLPAPIVRLVVDELSGALKRASLGDIWVTARHPHLVELATAVLALSSVESFVKWGVRWHNGYEQECETESGARERLALYKDGVLICRDVTRGEWREVGQDEQRT